MGSYTAICPNCGETIWGRWDSDVDDPDVFQPREFTEHLATHFDECEGSFRTGAAVVCGMILMGEAIRMSQQWVASRREKVGKEKTARRMVT